MLRIVTLKTSAKQGQTSWKNLRQMHTNQASSYMYYYGDW